MFNKLHLHDNGNYLRITHYERELLEPLFEDDPTADVPLFIGGPQIPDLPPGNSPPTEPIGDEAEDETCEDCGYIPDENGNCLCDDEDDVDYNDDDDEDSEDDL